MTGRTHDLAAFTALSLIVVSQPPHDLALGTGILAVVANLIGGIAPDIDQPTAPFWKNLPIGGFFGRILDPLLGGHRFLSHSIIGIFIFGTVWHYFLLFLKPSLPSVDMYIIWVSFMIGFLSHLIMDTFNREGVPWFLPFPFKVGIPPFKFLRIQSGGSFEKYIIFPSLILLNVYIYYSNNKKILDLLKHHLQ